MRLGVARVAARRALVGVPLLVAGSPGFEFDVVPLVPGGDKTTVLSGDLDGDGDRELLLLGGREAAVHFLRDGRIAEAPDVVVELKDDVVAVDLGDVDGDGAFEIVCLTPSGVRAIRVRGDAAEPPFTVPVLSGVPAAVPEVPPEDVRGNEILLDLDGRGGEDAVIPTAEGYRILLRDDAGFEDGGLLDARPTGTISLSRGSDLGVIEQAITLPRIFAGDRRDDGGRELITFDGRAARVYAPPEGDEERWRLVAVRPLYSGHASLPEELLQSRHVRAVDLDGTGTTVLMVVRSQEGGLDFHSREPSSSAPFSERRSLRFDGWLLPPRLVDVDGDGRLDLLAPTIEALDLLALTKAFVSRSFRMRYALFLNRPDVRFRRTPDEVRELVLPLEYRTHESELEVENRMVYSFEGDFDGDGRTDFLMGRAPDELAVFRGTGAGYEEEPAAVWPIEDSKDDLTVRPRLLDLNADGRSDLLLLYDARRPGGDRYVLHLSR